MPPPFRPFAFRLLLVGGNGNDTGNDDAWEHPDLVVIDGGKGQLSAAIKGIQRANAAIPEICAIAKDKEEVFVPGTSHPPSMAALPTLPHCFYSATFEMSRTDLH